MMITINLKPGQKRKRAGGGLSDRLAQLKGIGAKVKDPLLMGALAVWVLVGGWLLWAGIGASRELNALQPRLEQAQSEQKRFQKLMDDKRRTERIRDSLQAQIGTIRRVDGERYVWPHIMDEVSKSLPAYTWLTGLKVISAAVVDSADTTSHGVQFEIQGRTVDIQAYTRFLRQLEASPWIDDVTALEAREMVEMERPVTGFTIRATFRPADSAYVRTVPLSQSVR